MPRLNHAEFHDPEQIPDPLRIFACVAGSRAYGTQTPDSSEDLRGIFVVPMEAHLALQPPPQQINDPRHDVVF